LQGLDVVDASSKYQAIIDDLYAKYKSRGFIQEDEALSLMDAHNLSLQEVERLTGILLGMGVLFDNIDDEEEYDKGQVDFETLFVNVVNVDPHLKEFIDYVREIQPPQRREWQMLIPQHKAGNEYATTRLFEMYLRSVVNIAYNFSEKYHTSLVDCIGDGMIGLVRALEKYELSEHKVFPGYYPTWVWQNITRNMCFTPNPLLYFPAHVRAKLYKLFDNIDEAGGIGTADLSAPELVNSVTDELACSVDEARNLLRFFEPMSSLDELRENEIEAYCSDNGAFEYEMIERSERASLRRVVKEALTHLKPNEIEVLELRYGLTDGTERTLEEVGLIKGLTRERIRQIESRALRKLQQPTILQRFEGYYVKDTQAAQDD